ncbi:MAG: hypothetical protein RQ866_04810, partial [Bacteroidales bacterium]|nr:hypothetical protein [Bacteroidales bacterium]
LLTTRGISPLIDSDDSIIDVLKEVSLHFHLPNDTLKIYFFGTGCFNVFGEKRINKLLKHTFSSADIVVSDDLSGAAKAACGNDSGLVSVLGTGANCGFFDGNIISYRHHSAGYLLGDEGSGFYIAQKLLNLLLYNRLPDELKEIFYADHKLSSSSLIHKIYSSEAPHRAVAAFLPWFAQHKDIPEVNEVVKSAFDDFIDGIFLPVFEQNYTETNIITGGVAYNFSETLIYCFSAHHLPLPQFLKSTVIQLNDRL